MTRPTSRPRFRPSVEPLGDRILPALTLTVTTAQDVVNATDGVLSLREAITNANATAGQDTIVFAAALAGRTILLQHGQMWITDALAVRGPGASKLTIDAQLQSRIFEVTTGVVANLSGLTLTRGATG